MRFVLDTHTHTLASGHAYNTINEMAAQASEIGLELLAITEHGPKMPSACGLFYFMNLRVVRRKKYGVEILLGVEANIIDFEGRLDLDEYPLKEMDICIASLHTPCLAPGSREENTNAYLGAMKNPYVNIIGHPDDSRYDVDYESLVKAAKENHVLLEMNNSSLAPNSFREDPKGNQLEILRLCKKYETAIVIGSDAHTADDIADFQYVEELLLQTDFPEHLIMNTSTQKLKDFLDFKTSPC